MSKLAMFNLKRDRLLIHDDCKQGHSQDFFFRGRTVAGLRTIFHLATPPPPQKKNISKHPSKNQYFEAKLQ